MRDKTIKLNNTFEYLVPNYTDPEGNIVKLKVVTKGNYSLKNPFHYIQGDVLVFNPRTWAYLGSYNLSLELSDSVNATYYPFRLTITNSAPYFSGPKPSN